MENNSITIDNISDYFLSKKALTPKKLQKLVYYAYAWFIALNNQCADEIECVLFNEEPEAWVHGPVFPSLYSKYKKYYWQEIEKKEENVHISNEDVLHFLDTIWNTFGIFSADELEYMTHKEEPWINARMGISPVDPSCNKISKKDIFIYYNKLANEQS